MRRSIFLFFALSSVLAAAPGCSDDTSGGPQACDEDTPCPHGQFCSDAGICMSLPDGGPVPDGTVDAEVVDGAVDAAPRDSGPDVDSGPCGPGEEPCGNECCAPDQFCYEGACILDQGPCEEDSDCQEDSYCAGGICLPYGLGPRGDVNQDCTRLSIAGLFQPALQCSWTGPPAGDPYPNHIQVLSTPMVADFDFDGNPAEVHPSIVIMTYDGLDGDSGVYQGHYGVIRILDGATCEQLYNVGTQLNGCNPPAIGDLDGDGRPDIVVHTKPGAMQAFTYDPGTDSWVQLFVGHRPDSSVVVFRQTGWAAPAIHDLDDDGLPEVIGQSRAAVYDHEGLLLSSGVSAVELDPNGRYPVVADLDLDGLVELALGNAVYEFDPNARTWTAEWTGGAYPGFVAVADFGTYGDDPSQDDRLTKDGIAEMVSVQGGRAAIMTVTGRVVFGPVTLPGSSGGGPPTVGDFDGDGLAEFSAAGSDSYTVFDPDCTGLPDFSRCHSLRTDGILWTQDSQDYSSNQTGSSLFDFEGDGRVEVIYADEVFARVYDGTTGEVLFSTWTSSCTWNENPMVADVDGDFNAELVVPSNRNCGTHPRSDKHWSFAPGSPFYETSPRGNPMDPLFRGLRCETGADCLSGVCDAGYCRCQTDDDCGGAGSGFVCAPPPGPPMSPTPGNGNTCRAEWLGSVNGVRVFQDVLDRWVRSRTIWNQHTYSVTNVNEDGTIPRTSQWTQNWLRADLNNFRQNVQGTADVYSSPDVTSRTGTFDCTPRGEAILHIVVCNRGTEPVGAVPVSFYRSEDGNLVCTAETQGTLGPGDCQQVSCQWDDPPHSGAGAELTVVADDDGTGSGVSTECVEGNNSAAIHEVMCSIVE